MALPCRWVGKSQAPSPATSTDICPACLLTGRGNQKRGFGDASWADIAQEWADRWWQPAPISQPPLQRQKGPAKSPARRMRCSPSSNGVKSCPITSTGGSGGRDCARELAEGLSLPCGHQNSASRCHLGEGQGKRVGMSWFPLQEPGSLVTAWDTGTSRWHVYSQELPWDLDPLSKILMSSKPSLSWH